MQNNTKNSTTASLNWQALIPQFPTECQEQYFARLKRECILWLGNMMCHTDSNGSTYWTYYPLTKVDWQNSFGEWLNANIPPGLFDRSEVYPEPIHPLAFSYWLEYISNPERATHYARCKWAWEEDAA